MMHKHWSLSIAPAMFPSMSITEKFWTARGARRRARRLRNKIFTDQSLVPLLVRRVD